MALTENCIVGLLAMVSGGGLVAATKQTIGIGVLAGGAIHTLNSIIPYKYRLSNKNMAILGMLALTSSVGLFMLKHQSLCISIASTGITLIAEAAINKIYEDISSRNDQKNDEYGYDIKN